MKKILLIWIIGIFLVLPLIQAQGNITTLIQTTPLPDFTAGETVSTTFSFNYPAISQTYPYQIADAPLVLIVNISSSNSDYPVWKWDFELLGIMNELYEFECTENDFSVDFPYYLYEITKIPNGTYYCTNEEFLAMGLDSNNEVVLNVKSNPALWPGEYNFSVSLFYPELNLTLLTVYSPIDGIYNTRRTLFNMTINEKVELIEYINYNDRRPRWKRLCRNCDEYGFYRERTKTLKEGENNISIKAIDYFGQIKEENITIFIDSKKPRIRRTYPQMGFTDGLFEIEFEELNPKEVWLNYGNSYRNAEVNLSACVVDRRYTKCNISVNLSDYDGKEIEYWFNISDIAGNTDESRHRDLDVDLSDPIINNVSYEIDGRSVYFSINVTEAYLDEVGYFYNNSKGRLRERRLCSKLEDGICEKKVSFGEGYHNIAIYVIDEIGNKVEEDVFLFIDSKKPRISRILPRRNKVINGSEFYIKYTEDNLEKIELFWNPSHELIGCSPGRNQECTTFVDLIGYDGDWIEYWFEVSDVINKVESRKTRVLVDITSPELTVNFPEDDAYGRRVPFNITVTEDVTLEYRDESVSNPRWRRLCTRCDEYGNSRTRTKSFSRGIHEVLIRAVDKAGNSDIEEVEFEVDY